MSNKLLYITTRRLDNKIKVLEGKHNILDRWGQTCEEYRVQILEACEIKRNALLVIIYKHANQYAGLVALKPKYAGSYTILKHVPILCN